MDPAPKPIISRIQIITTLKIIGWSAVSVGAMMWSWHTTYNTLGPNPIQFFFITTLKFAAFFMIAGYFLDLYRFRKKRSAK